MWLKRLSPSGANTAVVRTFRVRIILRNKLKREPHSAEILEYLTSGQSDAIPYKDISAAFRAGEEVRPKFVAYSIVL
jgi:hypothetical protein